MAAAHAHKHDTHTHIDWQLVEGDRERELWTVCVYLYLQWSLARCACSWLAAKCRGGAKAHTYTHTRSCGKMFILKRNIRTVELGVRVYVCVLLDGIINVLFMALFGHGPKRCTFPI